MRPSILLALAITVLPVLAQNETETSVTVQSPPFNLVVLSDNSTLNGTLLGACHDGAGEEGLCIVGGPNGVFNYTSEYVNFQFNTTRDVCTETNSTGTYTIPCTTTPTDPTLQTGIVTWALDYEGEYGPGVESQAMGLVYSDNTNVALAHIGFVDGNAVAFDKNGLMNILSYQDDTKEPGNEDLYPTPEVLYRWYICVTYYASYHYTALTWVMGIYPPENPTCQKVGIKRVFV